jgi:type VI secretion system protein ImpG
LISHLALNHLSLVDGGEAALRGLLALYNLPDRRTEPQLQREAQQQIDGIVAVASAPVMERMGPPGRRAFQQGTEVDVTLDETAFVGASSYLLGAVLDRFFSLYAAANSYTRLTLRSTSRAEPIMRFPPRSGVRRLL